MSWPPALMLTAVLTACTATATAPTVERDASGFPKPDRPVGEIVSSSWADEDDRDELREFEQVVAAAGITRGMTTADIGAGSGYYVVRLSRFVGPEGRVIAEDIVPEYLADLDARVRSLGLTNVTLVQGAPDDPTLAAASVDVAFLIHMYHEIEQPYGLAWRLAKALKPNGQVVIVDQPSMPYEHGTPPDLLRCELGAIGYREVSFRTLDDDDAYVAVFAAPAGPLPDPVSIKPCAIGR